MTIPASANSQISNLILPVGFFINHVKQLQKIKSDLEKYRQVSLIGYSGSGKTQLIRMYAYENKERYKLLWFIDGNLDIEEELLKLSKAINKGAKQQIIAENTKTIVKDTIEYLKSTDDWLVVIDNLKIGQNYKITPLINFEHNGHIIVSSQDGNLLSNIIKIEKFKKPENILLAKMIIENKESQFIEFLADEFRGYPLLIVQGAQLLNNVPTINQEQYKQQIINSADKILLNIQLAFNNLSPSAKDLILRISLINNQAFSKDFLKNITSNTNTLDDDLYQLSKFSLIDIANTNEQNPVFEMHDLIAEKIIKLSYNSSTVFNDIIEKLATCFPSSIVKAHIYRDLPTVRENLEIVANNLNKYDIQPTKQLGIRLQLATKYTNAQDINNAEKYIKWFESEDERNNFIFWLMDFQNKKNFIEYLTIAGTYYRRIGNSDKSIKYYLKSIDYLKSNKELTSLKFNAYLQLAKTYLLLGDLINTEKYIQLGENIFNDKKIDKLDMGILLFAKARFEFIKGNYNLSLEHVNEAINQFLSTGIEKTNIYLTSLYMLKSEIYNSVHKYDLALQQLQLLLDMQKKTKSLDHEIFAKIFNQTAKANLGLGNIELAQKDITKAIDILLKDKNKNPSNANYQDDQDLANSYKIQGDIYAQEKKFDQALKYYNNAYNIYFYAFKDNTKHVAYMSDLYLSAGFAAHFTKDTQQLKYFIKTQIEEFGSEHHNSKQLIVLSKS